MQKDAKRLHLCCGTCYVAFKEDDTKFGKVRKFRYCHGCFGKLIGLPSVDEVFAALCCDCDEDPVATG